ncbi:MAG: hypothetical protein N3D16_11655, partial [Anaerolineales bacterium]|nr:hypothetical protein [Anaerolineales bacterium]
MKRTAPLNTTFSPWESYLFQGLIALTGGIGLFILLFLLASISLSVFYNGRIYPNVRVAGLDVSGMTLEQAKQAVQQNLLYPEAGKIILQDGERIWVFHPSEFGFFLDAQKSAVSAYLVGRDGPLWTRLFTPVEVWLSGVSLSPRMTYDCLLYTS